MNDTTTTSTGHLRSQIPPFAIIPRWVIRHPDLTSTDLRVYCALADRANGDQQAWPSHRTIADDTGVSRPTVRRALSALQEVGALHVDHRRRDDGAQSSNVYTVMVSPPVTDDQGGDHQRAGGVITSDHGGCSPVITQEQEPVEQEPVEPEDKPSRGRDSAPVDDQFDEWWKRYPRGRAGKPGGDGSKKKARQRWRRMTVDERQAAERAVDHYRQFVESPHGHWAKHAVTWLNQDCWEQWQTPATLPVAQDGVSSFDGPMDITRRSAS